MAKQPRAKVTGVSRSQRMGLPNPPQTYEMVQRGYVREPPPPPPPKPDPIRADPWEKLTEGNHRRFAR